MFSLIISFETSLDKLLIFDLFTLFKVRKSREKKKQREQETEKRVKELSDENGALQNKLDIALKEMNLLKNLYKNIGVQLPADVRDKLENELSKFKWREFVSGWAVVMWMLCYTSEEGYLQQ